MLVVEQEKQWVWKGGIIREMLVGSTIIVPLRLQMVQQFKSSDNPPLSETGSPRQSSEVASMRACDSLRRVFLYLF